MILRAVMVSAQRVNENAVTLDEIIQDGTQLHRIQIHAHLDLPSFSLTPSNMYDRAVRILNQIAVSELTRSSAIKAAPRTLFNIMRNSIAVVSPIQKKRKAEYNQAVLSSLGPQQSVLLFFHGYYQHAGAAERFIQDAHSVDHCVIAPSYDYRMHPEQFAEEVLWRMIKAIADKGAYVKGVIGHSTGADNCRYALLRHAEVQDYANKNTTTFVFSAPVMNGLSHPNLAQQAFLRLGYLLGDSQNLAGKLGEEHLRGLNQPIHPELIAYTFLCRDDILVTVPCGLDTNQRAVNLIYPGGGHFAGSGINSRINRQYLAFVEKKK